MVKTIIVEDEEVLRREIALTTPWEELGCTLLGEAVNGREGLELILKVRPHLVITDIRMPGLDGLGMLTQAARHLGDDAPQAVLLTGHSDFEYARKGMRLGVKDYLLKPVDDEEFYSLLRKISREIEQEQAGRLRSRGMDLFEGSKLSLFREYTPSAGGDSKDDYVRRAVNFIGENFAKDISLGEAAEKLGITQSYLSRLFKERTGYTFLEYLTYHRLGQAVKLLKDRSLRINEAAHRTGFRDHGYFTQLFRRYMGVTPGQFRNGEDGRTSDSDLS